jgi:hypothetical protein
LLDIAAEFAIAAFLLGRRAQVVGAELIRSCGNDPVSEQFWTLLIVEPARVCGRLR